MTARVPSVFVVVLNWNNFEMTAECLESLRNVTYPAVQVVVVDNGSTDGSAAALRARFPEVTSIQNDQNLGFSGGNNAGITYAQARRADYVLLLNNDTVVAPDFLEPLVAVAERDPRIGMVCPKIYFETLPGEIWAAGTAINLRRWRKLIPRGRQQNVSSLLFELRGHHEPDAGQFDRVEDVDGATGCACLMKREALEAVGLLDPTYFLIHEDSDWSLRTSRAGYRIVLAPASRVWHRVTASGKAGSALVVYYTTRNALLFVKKHATLLVTFWVYLLSTFILLKDCLKWGLRLGNRPLTAAKIRATLDFFRGRAGEWPRQA